MTSSLHDDFKGSNIQRFKDETMGFSHMEHSQEGMLVLLGLIFMFFNF